MRNYLNWKIYLIVIAVFIFSASLYYTDKLAKKLSEQETLHVEQLAGAIKTIITSKNDQEITFASDILTQNNTIPLIFTDDGDMIRDTKNLENTDTGFVKNKLKEFKLLHAPIICEYPGGKDIIYYGDSFILAQLRYFPYVQIAVILIFLIVVIVAVSSANRSVQDRVWMGLSKETAHQLGTPLSSIEGWLELLADHEENADAVTEMRKDLDRLKLVADRFSKVGSAPQLAEENLMSRLKEMVSYMQRRAPARVVISLQSNEEDVPVNISSSLMDWVIENLIRNALDAMDGKGTIDVKVTNHPQQVWIDVCDSGKGIPRHQIKKVFNPGFTTKKRGWGLGLSLARRIVEIYHHGSIFVKHSELGKGTIFRIILRR